jgi:hypothetical protein
MEETLELKAHQTQKPVKSYNSIIKYSKETPKTKIIKGKLKKSVMKTNCTAET